MSNAVISSEYKPSLSSGTYGTYTFPGKHDIIPNYNLTQFSEIFVAAKTAEIRTKLVFKPECNHKGCTNKPSSIDPKWLKGDMFVCKQHRMKMAQELKQSKVSSPALIDIIFKLENMTDEQLLSQGLELEANDFCIMAYSAAYYQKVKIVKEMLGTKRNNSRYWKLKIKYKQLQKECDFLLGLRKISNPFLTALIVGAVLTVFACGVVVACMLCNNGKTGSYVSLEQRRLIRERAVNAAENKEQLKDVYVLMKELDKQIIRNANLKKECILLIQKEDQKYKDGMKKIADTFDSNIAGKMRNLQGKWDKNIKQKEKDLDDLMDEKEAEMTRKLDATRNHWDNAMNAERTYWDQLINDKMNETNPWTAKTAQYQSALFGVKSKINNTMNEIVALDTDCKALMTQLEEEEDDLEAWEKKMIRLENLENKRHDFKQKLMKQQQEQIQYEDDMKLAENEKIEWDKKNEVEVNALKAQQEIELNALKQRKDIELQVVQKQKKMELEAMHRQKEEELKAMRRKKELEIENMKKEQEKERKLREKKLKQEMEEEKRIQREKMKQIEAEQEATDYQRAKAIAEKLCREQTCDYYETYTFIVYHKDKGFNVELLPHSFHSSQLWSYETWRYVGNWRICKVRTKRSQGKLQTWWRYSTEDTKAVWYRHYGETEKVTHGSNRYIKDTEHWCRYHPSYSYGEYFDIK